jgi:membrane protease YdiL (CAAX protease family)
MHFRLKPDHLSGTQLLLLFLLVCAISMGPMYYFWQHLHVSFEMSLGVGGALSLLVFVFAFVYMLAPRRIVWREIVLPGHQGALRRDDWMRQLWLVLGGCTLGAVLFEVAMSVEVLAGNAAPSAIPVANAAGFWPWLIRQPGSWVYRVFVVATLEELCYRGIILRYCQSEWGPTWALIANTALFGAMHLFAPGPLVLSLVLAAIYLHCKSLLPAIGLHASWNFLVYVKLWSHTSPLQMLTGDYAARGHYYARPLQAAVLPLLAMAFWLAWRSRPAPIVEFHPPPTGSQEGSS